MLRAVPAGYFQAHGLQAGPSMPSVLRGLVVRFHAAKAYHLSRLLGTERDGEGRQQLLLQVWCKVACAGRMHAASIVRTIACLLSAGRCTSAHLHESTMRNAASCMRGIPRTGRHTGAEQMFPSLLAPPPAGWVPPTYPPSGCVQHQHFRRCSGLGGAGPAGGCSVSGHNAGCWRAVVAGAGGVWGCGVECRCT